jgi:uncharacterized membrane protein
MALSYLIKLYSLTAVVFLAIDVVWLGLVAKGFYQQHLGHLLREQALLLPALLFYAVYIAGVLVFSVLPGLEADSLKRTVALGAFLGFLAYATFDLTCMALFDEFPPVVVFVDLVWGTALTGSVAAAGFGIARFLDA